MSDPVGGRIVTFYSYKGGTGRSMALANVAWILAAAGQRVLIVDWDMEAPGVHQYFRPFLPDLDFTSTPGVIDFVTEFAVAATTPTDASPEWFVPYADLTRFAVSLQTPRFPSGGSIDFVSAGKQGPAYATRVNSFDWQSFWNRLGGAALINEMREQLRSEYDYVLIDSRTGVSDTSGICTVALPDVLVVAFTLNRQSITGAAAVTASVVAQRDRSRYRVYPVPMRVEPAEKDRLDLAREEARHKFDRFLWHIDNPERDRYWGEVEVTYQPYYAYEEVLAVFADRPDQRTSVLAALEHLAARVTDGAVKAAISPPETERQAILELYRRQASVPVSPVSGGQASEPYVFLSYGREAGDFARRLIDELERGTPPVRVWYPERDAQLGDVWLQQITEAIKGADCFMTALTSREIGSGRGQELQAALEYGKAIVPLVLEPDALSVSLDLAGRQAIDFTADFDTGVARLRDYLLYVLSAEGERANLIRRLDDTRSELEQASTESERLAAQVQSDDIQARLSVLPSSEAADAAGELRLEVSDDAIRARWRGADVVSSITRDPLQRRLLALLNEWLTEGRLNARHEFQILGELLYATMFSGAVAGLLSQALEAASSESPLRVVFVFASAASDLAALPWEFLYRSDEATAAGGFLSTRPDVLISHARLLSETVPAPRSALRLSLVVADFGASADEPPDALVSLPPTGVAATVLGAAPIGAVLDMVEDGEPLVLHLIAESRRGSIEPEILTGTDRDEDWISPALLAHMLGGLTSLPALIILELSGTGRLGADEFAGRLATIPNLAAVLHVSPRLTGPSRRFFEVLYSRLAEGAKIDEAVAAARRTLTRQRDFGAFGLPVLYMNHPGPIGRPAPPAAEPPEVAEVTPSIDLDPDGSIHRRLRRSLEAAYAWRTLDRLAVEAAVPEATAAAILRNDDEVRFSLGRSGNTIVGLISRVGPSPQS